jgi:hypothetical protein
MNTQRTAKPNPAWPKLPKATNLPGLAERQRFTSHFIFHPGENAMRDAIRKRLLCLIPTLGILTATSPALAASDYCAYSIYKFWNLSCETATGIPANRAGHFIYFVASPFAHYRVYDHVTYATLRTGNAGSLGAHGTIFGLYGNWYSMIVNGPPTGWAYINNT